MNGPERPRHDLTALVREHVAALCTVHTYTGDVTISDVEVTAHEYSELFDMEVKLVNHKARQLIAEHGMGGLRVTSAHDENEKCLRTTIHLTILRPKPEALAA